LERRGNYETARTFYIDPKKYETTPIPTIRNKKTARQRKEEFAKLVEKNAEKNIPAIQSGFAIPWNLKCAVVIERPQVLVPLREPWLEEYNEWRMRWDKKIIDQYPPVTSIDDDAEMSRPKAEEKKKKEKKEEKVVGPTETEEEKAERLAKEDRLARIEAIRATKREVAKVKVGSRTTEADRKNDTRSLYRKLDQKLFLIVKKHRPNYQWQFPQSSWKEGETMRQTAERIVKTKFNVQNSLHSWLVGHSPISYVSYTYPEDQQKILNTYGAKIFFYYGFYINGAVSLDKSIVDYAWVTKDELSLYLKGDYLEELKLVLPNNGINELLTRDYPNYSELRKRKPMDNVAVG